MRLILLLTVLIQLKGFEQHPNPYPPDYEQSRDDSIQPYPLQNSHQPNRGYPADDSQNSCGSNSDYENPRNTFRPPSGPMFGEGAPQKAFPQSNVLYLPPSQPNGPYQAQIKLPKNIEGYQLVNIGNPSSGSSLDYNKIVSAQLNRPQIPQENRGNSQIVNIAVPNHQNDYQLPQNYRDNFHEQGTYIPHFQQNIPQNHGQYVPKFPQNRGQYGPQAVPQYFSDQVPQYNQRDSPYQSPNFDRNGHQFASNPFSQSMSSYDLHYNSPQDRGFRFAQQNSWATQYEHFPQTQQDFQNSPNGAYPQSPYSQSPFPQSPFPQSPYPQSPYPQSTYPQSPYPQSPYPQSPYPQSPYPQSPYSQSPYPQSPYPQSSYPQSPFPQAQPYPQSPFPQAQPYPQSLYPQAQSNRGQLYQDGYQVVNEYPENHRPRPYQSQQQGGQFDEEGFQVINEGPVDHYVSYGIPSTKIIVPKHTIRPEASSISATNTYSRSETSNNKYENHQSNNNDNIESSQNLQQQQQDEITENEQPQVSQSLPVIPSQESDIQQPLVNADVNEEEISNNKKFSDAESEH